MRRSIRQSMGAIGLAIVMMMAIVGCSLKFSQKFNQKSDPRNVQITLVSFAVTKAAHKAIIPKFVEQWQCR